MKTFILKSLAALALSAALGTALAQGENPPPPPPSGVSGSGVSASAGLGIDMAAGQTPGSNNQKGGGLTEAIDRAMEKQTPACGKLKCD